MCKSRILIVDDDEMFLAVLRFSFDLLLPGCQISAVSDAAAALTELRQQPFDLILTDYDMPKMNGLALAQAAHQIPPSTRIVLMTAGYSHDEIQTRAGLVTLGGFLPKPFPLLQLAEILRKNGILTIPS
jgi:CheY-like chemotaxis protein